MDEWIGVSDAKKLSGKSVSTIHRWCDNKYIKSRKRKDGRKILKSSLLNHLATNVSPTPPTKNEEIPRDVLREKDEMIHLLKESNRELREQNRELQSELIKNSHELRAILSQQTGTAPSRWKRDEIIDAQ